MRNDPVLLGVNKNVPGRLPDLRVDQLLTSPRGPTCPVRSYLGLLQDQIGAIGLYKARSTRGSAIVGGVAGDGWTGLGATARSERHPCVSRPLHPDRRRPRKSPPTQDVGLVSHTTFVWGAVFYAFFPYKKVPLGRTNWDNMVSSRNLAQFEPGEYVRRGPTGKSVGRTSNGQSGAAFTYCRRPSFGDGVVRSSVTFLPARSVVTS